MNVSHRLWAWFCLAAIVACGGGATRVYTIAVDRSPLNAGTLDGSCYTSGQKPQDRTSTSGLASRHQWTVWDGPDGRQFLDARDLFPIDMGDVNFQPLVDAYNTLEGRGRAFTAQRVFRNVAGGTTTTQTWDLGVRFTDFGATARGTIVPAFSETCTGCAAPPSPSSCTVTLPFSGALLPVSFEESR